MRAPGQTLDLALTETVHVNFDQAAPFSPGCFEQWNWTNLLMEPDVTIPSTPQTGSPLFIGNSSIRLTGEVQFEHEPVDLGTTSVCPGTHPGGAPLSGLCIAEGGGRVARLTAPADHR